MRLSVVIPVFNEEDGIEHNLKEILSHLKDIGANKLQVIVVDDGSYDQTVSKVAGLSNNESCVELLCLNRNFGKESAVSAGLEKTSGDAVIVMDSDLQHPPELIGQMVAIWKSGIKVVDACKSHRGKEPLTSVWGARIFYFLFSLLTKIDLRNKSDFKLLDREVVDAYQALPERNRFFRGIVPWMGFSTAQVYFDVPDRVHGRTSWSRIQLIRLALMAMTNFTSAPLHLVNLFALFFFASAIVVGGIAIYQKLNGMAAGGFPTVILLILITGSIIMFSLGQIGIYIKQIFEEVKQRPLYLVDKKQSRLKQHNTGENDTRGTTHL